MDRVIAHELLIVGSPRNGRPRLPAMIGQMADGALRPDLLVGRTIPLDEAAPELAAMGGYAQRGVTVVRL